MLPCSGSRAAVMHRKLASSNVVKKYATSLTWKMEMVAAVAAVAAVVVVAAVAVVVVETVDVGVAVVAAVNGNYIVELAAAKRPCYQRLNHLSCFAAVVDQKAPAYS